MVDKVKWGVLGCANFAKNRTIPAMLEAPSVELVGVASRTEEKAESFRSNFGLARSFSCYQMLVDDPDIQAIYCPLSNDLHAEWMIRAARNGKHTLCEKPFTLNADQAKSVARVAGECGVQVAEAFMWRLHPQHIRALDQIRNGAIGKVRLVRSAFTFQMGRNPNFRWDPKLGGGSVMDVGCYTVSAARYYFEGEPMEVYARGSFDPETGIDMSMAALVEFSEGSALLDCGFHLPGRSDLEIAGDKGSIRIPDPWLPPEQATIVVNGKEENFPPVNQYVNEFEAFSRSILEGKPAPFGVDDAVQQMAVIDAVFESMKTGSCASVH